MARGSGGRLGLQVVLVLIGVVALTTGILNAVIGTNLMPTHSPKTYPDVESNYRFFAAIWATFGLVFLWIVPRVERATFAVRAVSGAIFFAGLVRLATALIVGTPAALLIVLGAIALLAPPLVVFWQAVVAAASRDRVAGLPEPEPATGLSDAIR
jgi:hypothetical protein